MTQSTTKYRMMSIVVVIFVLVALLVYVALRTGPLAPVAVTVTTVQSRAITPAVFGIGTIEARYTYKVSPSSTSKLTRLDVNVGDVVHKQQVIGLMDVVDIDARILSQKANYQRTEAIVLESTAKQNYAHNQVNYYKKLFLAHAVSEDIVRTKKLESELANAALAATKADLSRIKADIEALNIQKANFRLIASADGIVTARLAELGATVLASQPIIEFIDPQSLWINVRFDQVNLTGLSAELPAYIVLRSHKNQILTGKILRVEPKADIITEEAMAKVVFDTTPSPLPLLGELAEVSINLPSLPASPVVPNAAIQHQGEQVGVWKIIDNKPYFTPVSLGEATLEGDVQITQGLKVGDKIVVYSEKALLAHHKLRVVDSITEAIK
ncbi:MAG: efflux RND transporter periplasmic adaptor subunit [Moraxellaceae bacterium]|nr:efflux RND transporter periplasmic adaptor subunit [Moraxellaceae bacterium]